MKSGGQDYSTLIPAARTPVLAFFYFFARLEFPLNGNIITT